MKKNKFGLLPRIIQAIILGILCGNVFPLPLVRVFETYNSIFSQFLGFMVPLIIVGLVIPAIADIGKGAGRLLIVTVILAYLDTICAGFLSYGTGSYLFPDMIANSHFSKTAEESVKIMPYFTLNIPPLLDVMSGLILSFVVGLCITMADLNNLRSVFNDFKEVISITISKILIPLLPLYIFGVFLNMTHSGQAYHIMLVFAQIIIVIFILHVFILLYQYVIAGAFAGKNPLRLLATMVPAYLTALGTSSSAATIPVTLKQTIAICLLEGLPHDPLLFMNFILMLSIMMVAAPGVPGGAVMAALAPLASILGFDSEQQALMIALYIAMDSFGTACNVTGDGAIAVIIDRFFKRDTRQVV